ncbi:ATP-binding protein [Paenibacillus sp. FSL H8-0259]|uniref:ATP-binding protein n=1 Tax=Paenibacillus sp. FSL H8-0259 TaxID=1920423 RepID=UPI00096D72A1|nr:ATP-binding protein [Paenibacillus sp. FSL H8-0259]OMF27230.1 hypothetical protein BK132_16635 [Paenibacillus sp. FSL H8-0259]
MDTASKLIPANTFCIANLVGNALKFTEQGEVCLIVQTEAVAEDRITFSIEVKDTGIGLPVEQKTNLFRSFSQIHERRSPEAIAEPDWGSPSVSSWLS